MQTMESMVDGIGLLADVAELDVGHLEELTAADRDGRDSLRHSVHLEECRAWMMAERQLREAIVHIVKEDLEQEPTIVEFAYRVALNDPVAVKVQERLFIGVLDQAAHRFAGVELGIEAWHQRERSIAGLRAGKLENLIAMGRMDISMRMRVGVVDRVHERASREWSRCASVIAAAAAAGRRIDGW